MTKHAVIIAGAGPTGLMLAAELALARVDVAIVERRADQTLEGARAKGIHARTIEVLDQRGVAERALALGKAMQIGGLAMIPLDLADCPTRHRYGLAIGQEVLERMLAAWVGELAVPIYRAREVTDFAQDATGVDIALSDGAAWRARYLVGCDGGRSAIRKRAGIAFDGWEPSLSYLLAEGATTETPAWGLRRDDRGVNALAKLADGKRVGIVLNERQVMQGDAPSLDELRRALVAVYGTDFGVHDVTTLSRFTDAARQAARYREGRVLVAGDAAHVHSPVGGQGLNLGVQDAVNLGWKLAQVVHGTSPESLLDTYELEQRPVGARVLKTTLAAGPRAEPRRRSHAGLARDDGRAPDARRAAQALRREDGRARSSLRPRRGTSAARAPHARSRARHRRRSAADVLLLARCAAGAARARRAARYRTVGGSRPPRRGAPLPPVRGSFPCSAPSRPHRPS